MKIIFLLPCIKNKLPGGYRIVFEYAIELNSQGHEVHIVLPVKPYSVGAKIFPKGINLFQRTKLIGFYTARYLYYLYKTILFCFNKIILKANSLPSWLQVDGVHIHTPLEMKYFSEPKDSNAIIATWWETAWWLNQSNTNGKKFYFCQHYEDWGGTPELVQKSYEFQDLQLISISTWLSNLLSQKHNRQSFLLLNAVANVNFFNLNLPRKYVLGIILRFDFPWKGAQLALEIIAKLPGHLQILIASFEPIDKKLVPPNAINIVCHSPQEMCQFYNQCQNFLQTSLSEGFGLPLVEAMLCQTTVISTPVGCAIDFIQNRVNGFLAQSFNSSELAELCLESIQMNSNFRDSLQSKAYQTACEIKIQAQAAKLVHFLETS